MERYNNILFSSKIIDIAKDLNNQDCKGNNTQLNWGMITEGLRYDYCIQALKKVGE